MTSNSLQVEALQFAISFAQMNLTDANATETQRVVRGLDALLNPDRPVKWAKLPTIDHAVLIELQTEVLRFLTDVVEIGVAEEELKLTFCVGRDWRPGASYENRHNRDSRAYASTVNVLVYAQAPGQLRDWLLYRVIRLLEEFGADRLHTCPAPECGRLFFKVTRKEFCSTRCQSRVYMRAYREPDSKVKEPKRVQTRKK